MKSHIFGEISDKKTETSSIPFSSFVEMMEPKLKAEHPNWSSSEINKELISIFAKQPKNKPDKRKNVPYKTKQMISMFDSFNNTQTIISEIKQKTNKTTTFQAIQEIASRFRVLEQNERELICFSLSNSVYVKNRAPVSYLL